MEAYILAIISSFAAAIAVTPLVIKWAHRFGFVDQPNKRKVHQKPMPRIGGLTFIFGTGIGLLAVADQLAADWQTTVAILAGALPIIAIGLLDDKLALRARTKLLFQLLSASIVVIGSGVSIDFISIPFGERIDLGLLSSIVTMIWLIAMMNAINLIDGLDGLAAGVAIIALSTMLVIAAGNPAAYGLVFAFGFPLIGSVGGFLIFNFHPAKFFMGDTGSLFLGYMIGILSTMGFFKSVTIVSVVVPLFILGVPILDTVFAIIRRKLNRQKIGSPDKGHLHHCLLNRGYGHRQAVLTIYGVSLLFAACAILLSMSSLWFSLLVLIVVALLIQLCAECIGLIGEKRKPLLNAIRKWAGAGAPLRSK
ncbi:undecaprenyl-phosphate alpha-N-acetylglucosaminyl 1-phosphate transferase [Shouchella clausii]|uniref:glycosyltransferase family 4 protein n=1 Tax=Shouchella clausii TaxID=79880 RepID=UPI000BA66CF8|nr:MraY family glycosyltransferase [Shouchella clausii]PAF15121.1 undecaprenyl-phosphate alpha-N-acetylglucosaminyl 1-phosphate transferase [Shouchella clausii]